MRILLFLFFLSIPVLCYAQFGGGPFGGSPFGTTKLGTGPFGEGTTTPAAGDAMLGEDSGYMLGESGDKILLE